MTGDSHRATLCTTVCLDAMRLGIFALLIVAVQTTSAAADSCKDDKPFDAATFKERVKFLASKELDGRAPGSTGDAATRKLIVERFTCLGLSPAFGTSYEQAFTADNAKTANVVGSIKG